MPDVVITHETPVFISTASFPVAGATRLDIAGRFAYVPAPTAGIIQIFDVSNPGLMEALGDVNMPGMFPFDITISGRYGYISTLNSLQIIDISNINNVNVIGETASLGEDLRDIFIVGKHALVLVQKPTPKLVVVDIEDPTNPFEVNSLALNNTPERGHYNFGVIYTCDVEGGAHIINVNDPANPILQAHLDTTTYPELAGQGRDVYVSGRWMYTLYLFPSKMVLLDLSDPVDPAAEPPFTVMDANTIEVHADSAYLSNGEIIDVSDPFNLTSLIPDNIEADMITLVGKTGFALGADNLKAYNYSGIQTPTANIGSLKCSTIEVFDNINACNNMRIHNKLNIGQGGMHCDGDTSAAIMNCVQVRARSNRIGGSINPLEVGEVLDSVLAGAERFAVAAGFAVIPSPTDNSISILDVSNHINPIILTTFTDGSVSSPFAVVCQSDRAFISDSDSIFTLDISDKSNPAIIGTPVILNTQIKDLILQGNQLMGYNELTNELQTFTVTVEGEFITTGSLSLSRVITKSTIHEGFLYCTSSASGGIYIVDISNPKIPVLHKDFIDATLLSQTYDIAISGRFMYVTTDDGMEIYDIRDKLNPVRVGGFNDGLVHEAIQIGTDFVYLSNEIKIIDVRDPTNPVQRGGAADNHHAILISGKRIFALDVDEDEFEIYDVSGAELDSARIGTLHASSIDVANTLNVSDRVTIGDILSVGKGGVHSLGEVSAKHFHLDNDNQIHWNNVAGTEIIGIMVNLNDEIEFGADLRLDDKKLQWVDGSLEINSSNELESTARDLVQRNTDGTLKFIQERDQLLSAGNTIANYRARSQNSNGGLENFVQLRFRMEDSTLNSEYGSIQISMLNNGSGADWMNFNRNKSGHIDMFKQLDMNTQKIISVVDPTDPQDVATKNYVDTAGLEVFTWTDDHDAATNNLLNVASISGVGDVVQIIAKDFKINKTGTSQQMFFQRDEIQSNNTTIGIVRAESQDSGGTLRPFARMRMRMMDSAVGADEGSFEFNCRSNGGNKDYMYINDLGNDIIEMFANLDMSGNIITGLTSDPIDNTDAARKKYVDQSNPTLDNDVQATWDNNADDGIFGIKVNTNDEFEIDARTFKVSSPTGNSARLTISRQEILANTTSIGSIRSRALNDNPTDIIFNEIKFFMERDETGVEESSMRHTVRIGGSNVEILTLNENANNQIQMRRQLSMLTNKITNVVNPTNQQDVVTVNHLEKFTSQNYVYVKTADDFGILLTNDNITSFSDLGGGEIRCESAFHGLVTGNVVVFSGSTPYDSVDYEITKETDSRFKFTETFTSTGTGTWTAKKRQVYKSGFTNEQITYYILENITLDAPLLLTPPDSETPQYSFLSDVSGFNALSFDYATTLGSAFQGEGIESVNRTAMNTTMSSGLQTASVRTVDIGFITSGFSFYVDDALTDIGAGIHIRDANAVTMKNNSFYLVHTLGHKFTNCLAIDGESVSHIPIATLTTPMIEIVETTRTTQATFDVMKMDGLATGKDAFLIPSALDDDSRISITNCRVPDDANLFDSTGLDETDIKILAKDNQGHKNSFSICDIQHNTSTTATVTSTDEIVVVGGTNWVEGAAIERFSSTTAGLITYNGLEDFVCKIDARATVSKDGGGSDLIEVGFRINATDDLDSFRGVDNNGPVTAAPAIIITCLTGDTIQLVARNRTSNKDIILDNSNVLISAV